MYAVSDKRGNKNQTLLVSLNAQLSLSTVCLIKYHTVMLKWAISIFPLFIMNLIKLCSFRIWIYFNNHQQISESFKINFKQRFREIICNLLTVYLQFDCPFTILVGQKKLPYQSKISFQTVSLNVQWLAWNIFEATNSPSST